MEKIKLIFIALFLIGASQYSKCQQVKAILPEPAIQKAIEADTTCNATPARSTTLDTANEHAELALKQEPQEINPGGFFYDNESSI